MRFVAWPIPQYVLISKLQADLRSDIRQFVEVIGRENATACHLRDFTQEGGAVELFHSAAAIPKRVKDTDRIQLSIGFFHQPLDFTFIVAAMVIASIGQDEQ